MRLFITTDSSQLYKYLFKIKRTIFDECDFHTLCRWSSSLWLCMAPFLNLLLGLARTRFTWIQNGAIFFFHFKFFWWFLNFLVTFLFVVRNRDLGPNSTILGAVAPFFWIQAGQESDEYLEGGVRVSTFRSDHVDHEIYLYSFLFCLVDLNAVQVNGAQTKIDRSFH